LYGLNEKLFEVEIHAKKDAKIQAKKDFEIQEKKDAKIKGMCTVLAAAAIISILPSFL
jgi:hypothetical protein